MTDTAKEDAWAADDRWSFLREAEYGSLCGLVNHAANQVCIKNADHDGLHGDSDFMEERPPSFAELGFTHYAKCRHCGNDIGIARWLHLGGGESGEGGLNDDHRAMPDPATLQATEGDMVLMRHDDMEYVANVLNSPTDYTTAQRWAAYDLMRAALAGADQRTSDE